MATPSLAMIPSGYKASKVYSVLPESGVGDFDFTRATTATRVNSSGLIETVAINVPRLEYPLIDGVVNGCPSLLLEPQRANLIIHSENFSQWNLIGITVTSNSVISPNGLSNASKLVATSGTSNKVIAQSISANTYTASVFAKKGEFEGLFIGTGAVGAFFNLNTHTFRANYTSAPTSYKIEEYGNGWYRYSITFTISSGDNLYIGPNDNVSNTLAITGNGTNGIYTWGAQTEVGTYPTSYIKTSGSAVTRNAEVCTGAGNAATFNDSEGVLMLEASSDATTSVIWSVSDGSNSNAVSLYYGGQGVLCDIFSSAGTRTLIATMPIGLRSNINKFLIKYKSTDSAIWLNGFELAVNAQTISLSGLNELKGAYGSGSFPFYGNTKQIEYYNSALTDSELEKLTSWTSFSDMANGQQYSII